MKQTSKITYINWVLKVTIFFLFTVEYKGTSWDKDISKEHDMKPDWKGSESRRCRFQSFKIVRRKSKENKSCKLTRNIIAFGLLYMSFVFCGDFLWGFFVCLQRALWSIETFLRNWGFRDVVLSRIPKEQAFVEQDCDCIKIEYFLQFEMCAASASVYQNRLL